MENAKRKPKPKRKEFQDSGHIVNTEKQMTQDELRGVENRFKFPEQVLPPKNMNDKEIDAIIRLSNRYRKDVKVMLEDFDRLAIQEQVQFCALMAHLIESELHVDDSTLYEQFTLSFYDFKSNMMSQRSLEGLDSLLTDAKMALTQLFLFDKPSYRDFCDYIVTFMFYRTM